MNKVTYVLDLSEELSEFPRSEWLPILQEVGQYLVESILSDVGEAKSPVTGRQFKKLSPAYQKVKEKLSSAVIPNMELTGEMLDSLTFQIMGTRVEVGIWGPQADKADGHNNHSGESKIPRRPFIPNGKEGEKFRPEIREGVESIIEEKLGELDFTSARFMK